MSTFVVFSQKINDLWVEGRAKAGFLAAHRSIMGHLPQEYAYAGEVSLLIKPKGRILWTQAYNYPVYGATGFFGSVGNNEILGQFLGGYAFINFPFISRDHYTFSGKMGAGVGYGTKYYKKGFPEDSSTLYNVAIGSAFNALVIMALENRWNFGDHSITASLDMTHFSNGAMKIPNLGLNLPYASLGYGYRVRHGKDSVFAHPAHKKYWEFGAMAIGSVKEVEPIGGRKFPIVGLNAVARRYFRPKVAMEMSFDFIYKTAVVQHENDVPKTPEEIVQLGLFTGYILPLDRLHIIVGMGYYVRDKFSPEDFLYHRVGLRYVFEKGLNLNLVLKSHWARADYIEWGVGYTFKR